MCVRARARARVCACVRARNAHTVHDLCLFPFASQLEGLAHIFREGALQSGSRIGYRLHRALQELAHHTHARLRVIFGRTHKQVVAVNGQELDGVSQKRQEFFRERFGPADTVEQVCDLHVRREPVAVREQHEHGLQMRLGVLVETHTHEKSVPTRTCEKERLAGGL